MKKAIKLLMVAIIGCLLASYSTEGAGSFRGSAWGDSVADVIKREKSLVILSMKRM